MNLRQLRGCRLISMLLIVLLAIPALAGCTDGLGQPSTFASDPEDTCFINRFRGPRKMYQILSITVLAFFDQLC